MTGDAAPKDAAPKKVQLENQTPGIRNHRLVRQCALQERLPLRDIETTIADEGLARRLMRRVIDQWEALGNEPYWSNANLEENRLAKIDDKAIEAFYQDGTDWLATLAAFEARSGVTIPGGTCVELGAGTGKYTHALAGRFAHVVAIDVSRPHLDVSADYLKRRGIDNVTTAVLKAPDDLAQYTDVDFFLGEAVFPHNAPPIQRQLLDLALRGLKPGGFALFQFQDWIEGYTFSSRRFIEAAPDAACDGHCLPKRAVFEVMKANGVELLDFAPDFFSECFGSYSFFVRKTGGA